MDLSGTLLRAFYEASEKARLGRYPPRNPSHFFGRLVLSLDVVISSSQMCVLRLQL
jgi:hypothetical protein